MGGFNGIEWKANCESSRCKRMAAFRCKAANFAQDIEQQPTQSGEQQIEHIGFLSYVPCASCYKN
jgi:hypothetical protein